MLRMSVPQHHFFEGSLIDMSAFAPTADAEPAAEGLQVLSSLEDVLAATCRAAAGARRLVSIYTPNLEPGLYDAPDFVDVIKRFVLGRSFARVRVLTHEPLRLVGHGNRFVVMARRLSGCIEIRAAAARFAHDRSAMFIADSHAIIYRTRASNWDGVAGFSHPPVARLHLQDFDTMWFASAALR